MSEAVREEVMVMEEIERDSDRVEANLASWSKYDKLRAFNEMDQIIRLLESEVGEGAAFDLLMALRTNLKVFEDEKVG
jgi:hypothetical protein